jgi:predicted acyl esterase
MDSLLFGIENGLGAEPRVLVEDSTGTWHEGHDWPLEQSKHVTMQTAEGSLTGRASDPGSVSYEDALDAERGSWTDAHVAFETAALKKDMLVNGAPVLNLKASSSETSTKWVAYLLDVAPDGTWERISHGYADSHSWKAEDEWVELEPGKPYRWTIKLMPTAVVVKKGHKVSLLIASQDSRRRGNACFSDYRGGCYGPSGILPATTAGRAVNDVHFGTGGTTVEWDWADPRKTAKAPTPSGA